MSDNILDELKSTVTGVTISLPTSGQWYDPGVLSDGADPSDFAVNPFTMRETLNFQNPFKLMNGSAIYDMIIHTCPGVKSPHELLAVDVDAITVASRSASYGRKMDLTVKCSNPEMVRSEPKDGDTEEKFVPKCNAESKVRVDLHKVQLQYSSLPPLEEWTVTMDNGQRVVLRPPRYSFVLEQIKKAVELKRLADSKDAVGDQESEEDKAELDAIMERVLSESGDSTLGLRVECVHSVVSSKGSVTTDRATVSEWLSRIPSEWSDKIYDRLDELMKAPSEMGMTEFTCPHCGHTQKVSVTGDPIRFFTPGSLKK